MFEVLWRAARRLRDPMGWTPVRMSLRSSRRVLTRFGSRRGGTKLVGWVVVVSSSRRIVDVAIVRVAGVQWKLLRRQRMAGLMVYVGLDITG